MIIKATIHDNDYIRYLEQFFERFKFQNYYLYLKEFDGDDFVSLEKYRDSRIEMEHLFEKASFKESELTPDELSKFANFIKLSLYRFLKDHNLDESLPESDIEVECLDSMSNKWANGEVLYYFLQQDKYIVC